MCLCVFACACVRLRVWDLQKAWYIYDPSATAVTSAAGEFFINFLYYFLLMNQFIPVSLYVSMTSVKFIQSYFLVQVSNVTKT